MASQKVPSAIRRIKTGGWRSRSVCGGGVRKHQAPKGALRQVAPGSAFSQDYVRQKAASAIRCIKTLMASFIEPP